MRIIMMGTGPFAVPTFRALLASEHEVPLLVTRPPHGKHRRQSEPTGPMWNLAHAAGLPIEMPESINAAESIEMLRKQAADLLVVCDYGQILSPAALNPSRLGGINLHASLLPAYRGAAPIHWAIYDGCQQTGVTVIHMTARLDAGPSLLQRTVRIPPEETSIELEARLAKLGAASVIETVKMLAAWDGQASIGELQDAKLATKAPRLKRNDGEIDWTRTAAQIRNQWRAFQPWPGTFTYWNRPGQTEPLRLILTEIDWWDSNADTSIERGDRDLPGTVVGIDHGLDVSTGSGILRINAIQPSGRKPQPWDAFVRGYRIAPGDRLQSVTACSTATSPHPPQ